MAQYIAREVIGADIAREYKNARSAEKQVWSHVLGMIADAATIDPVHAAGGCYCRECIYGIPIDKSDEIRCCEYHDFTVWPKDGYCSYGQRREEADNGETI